MAEEALTKAHGRTTPGCTVRLVAATLYGRCLTAMSDGLMPLQREGSILAVNYGGSPAGRR